MSIKIAIEHNYSSKMIDEHKRRNSKLDTYEITIKDDFTYPGWAGIPGKEVKAFLIEYDGQEGFIFANKNDDYYRMDFLPLKFVESNPIFIETQHYQDVAEVHLENEIINQQEIKLIEEFKAQQELNKFLPKKFPLENYDSFKERESSSPSTISKIGQRLVGFINRYQQEVGSLPVFTEEESSTDSSVFISVARQLSHQKLTNKLGGQVDIKIDEDNVYVVFTNADNKQVFEMEVNLFSDECMLIIDSEMDTSESEVEVTHHFIDVSQSKMKYQGKDTLPGNSKLGNILENIMYKEYFSSEEVDDDSTTGYFKESGVEAVHISELNGLRIMTDIAADQRLLNEFKEIINGSLGIEQDAVQDKVKETGASMEF